MSFRPIDKSLFFSRGDANDPRLGDLVQALPPCETAEVFAQHLADNLNTSPQVPTQPLTSNSTSISSKGPSKDSSLDSTGGLAESPAGRPTSEHQKNHSPVRNFVLAGYPDDEGIRINGGRPGAALAPSAVRRPLYKMTPSLLHQQDRFTLWDAGDLEISEKDLFSRHSTAAAFARAALDQNATWISIGGGHDYGFPDAEAFIGWTLKNKSSRPLVINFDAHLDVRPIDKGLSSGTPFFRMLEKFGREVDFAEIGIQAHCNSRLHLEWVRSFGAKVLSQEEVEASGEPLVTCATRSLGDWLLRPRPALISVDIDGFSSSVAPGCSQSWATGFTPQDFFPLLQVLTARLDVRVLGLYEVSPPLDNDDRTSKLAAQIIHRVLNFASGD